MRVNRIGLIVCGLVNVGIATLILVKNGTDAAVIPCATTGLVLFNLGIFISNEEDKI